MQGNNSGKIDKHMMMDVYGRRNRTRQKVAFVTDIYVVYVHKGYAVA
jgi:hypothetical protein